jgi:hypothetical protein
MEEITDFFKKTRTSNWSLIKILQYRQKQNDFSYDKAREHSDYKKALETFDWLCWLYKKGKTMFRCSEVKFIL